MKNAVSLKTLNYRTRKYNSQIEKKRNEIEKKRNERFWKRITTTAQLIGFAVFYCRFMCRLQDLDKTSVICLILRH